MVIINDELNALSRDIWEWTKSGKPIEEAPEEIRKKAEHYKELHLKLKNEELKMMGCRL